ncbi:MAG: acyltransferase [Planctomycetales bacterium]|nr:acyltransferase [Planctomycetales bacterium]
MLIALFQGVLRRVRQVWLQFRGLRCHGRCWLQSVEIPRNHADIELQAGVALDCGVILLSTGTATSSPRIHIGSGTYINRHTMIDASERIEIGAHCMIGPFCYITDHDHGTKLGLPIAEQPLFGSAVIIEDGCWIGAHVTILKGVRIGAGAIVGAGAVVNRDVARNSIVVGVPAREIGLRS